MQKLAKRSLPLSFEKEAKSSKKNGLKALIKGNRIERVEWKYKGFKRISKE